MFASAWLLLASDREHADMLLTIHRSLGVVTWAGGGHRPTGMAIQFRIPATISAEHADGSAAARPGE
jgi:hypothetical protein